MCSPEIFGSDPANVVWQVVRGDTARIRVDFLENDEVTAYDTSTWTFSSTTYDFRGDVLDELEVIAGDGYVEITAASEITALWGGGYRSVSAELAFDLEVILEDDSVWTPILGTIRVLADISGSL
jgi:hypothetical protein